MLTHSQCKAKTFSLSFSLLETFMCFSSCMQHHYVQPFCCCSSFPSHRADFDCVLVCYCNVHMVQFSELVFDEVRSVPAIELDIP